MRELGMVAIYDILVYLFFIVISWWALSAINFERFVYVRKIAQVRIMVILFSVALGSIVGNFFISYLSLARQISLVFSSIVLEFIF